MRSVAVVALVTSCGFSVNPGGAVDDAPPDVPDDMSPDMPIDLAEPPRPCLAKWLEGTVQLSPPVPLTAVSSSTADDRDPFVSFDELTLYYASDRTGSTGGGDVYKAVRASTSAMFDTAVRADDLSSAGYDTRVTITADDSIAVRSATTNGSADLALATKQSSGMFGSFSAAPLAAINDASTQYDPEISPDGLRLYWAQGSPQKIMMVSRASLAEPFSNPVDIVATDSNNADPALSHDERILVFASTRTGSGDIYVATRASLGAPFGPPVQVPVVNTSGAAEGDPALSSDGCTLYFGSNRGSGSDWDLYMTRLML
jgi:Tol biopolymer transport system component